MNQPPLLDEVELLRKYKEQKDWSNAQLAMSMTAFGWSWSESYMVALFKGTMKPNDEKRDFIQRYLLSSYEDEALA